ncbi:Crp/Fnr family transcriptional regulator [Caulobacter segnis]|uniref:Crp/Fnr family transcriptional regulator n=1 Tax=Caulobacter segnis TaxID=88688 RepID=UPI00240F1B1D|nr:Crp/Fnr family transcriptional regulator [Caulobacter segnis]MDG2520369.1 Crp/Fnr family transcriptional regulator [Caulobacter segnis]
MGLTLIRKLENFAPLNAEEKQALVEAAGRTRRLAAGESIIHENDPTGGVNLIQEGLACRYKMLPDGRRSILGFFVPGDLCDLRVFILESMDHSIGALTPTTVATLSREAVLDILERFPRLTRALWWSTLVDEAITREWVVNIGQRTALERLAHLLCELYHRLSAVQLTDGGVFELPLTQAELADSLGLSTVHVNRTLQELRRSGALTLRGRHVEILDLGRLEAAAMFNPNYLHLQDRDEPAARRGL